MSFPFPDSLPLSPCLSGIRFPQQILNTGPTRNPGVLVPANPPPPPPAPRADKPSAPPLPAPGARNQSQAPAGFSGWRLEVVPGAPLKGVGVHAPEVPSLGTLCGPVTEGSGAGRLGTGCPESRKQSEVFGTGVKGGRRCLGSGRRPHRRAVEQRPRGMPLLSSERASPVPARQGSLGTEVARTYRAVSTSHLKPSIQS